MAAETAGLHLFVRIAGIVPSFDEERLNSVERRASSPVGVPMAAT
jgi:hypothetical protein